MLNQADITSTIKSIPWFLELDPESITRLSGIANLCSFNAGDIIFSEGEQHPIFYILLEGKVLLESFVPGHGILPIFVAESLDVIGWSSLTPMVRQKTSTARVLEYTAALSFTAESLMELCESDCELGFIFMRRLANIVASRYLNHKLHLLELISDQGK
ncbi:cyclic nucleotide-binding domain-containing protein [Chloroflexota bacterium]|nr:cyclic nucleotide-binding domain-containing protein [Chloroflexota bacterium]